MKYTIQSVVDFRFAFLFILVFGLGGPVFAQSPVPDNATAQLLASGYTLSEGPFWHPDGYLLFSDVSRNTIFKWTEANGVETFLNPSGQSNGITSDLFGNVIIAQHQARQIGKLDVDTKTITPLVTRFGGNRFHSPNDLVVKSDGAIFFTDPPWGGNPSELSFHGVYRLSPTTGQAQLLASTLNYPNGIAFSPDESLLYVSETLNSRIHVYDVVNDSTLANRRIFATVNQHGNSPQSGADGLKVDNDGNVWAVGSEGVAVFAPDGGLLGIINVPGSTTNLAFGGSDRLILFVTNFTALYKVELGDLIRLDAPENLVAARSDGNVILTLEGSGESVKYISVYRSTNEGPFEKILALPYAQTIVDTNVTPTDSYSYKVSVTDVRGFESGFSNESGVLPTSIEETKGHIPNFELLQNYPNPFNPVTNISYRLSEAGAVRLEVFDITGRRMATLVDESQLPGSYSVIWDGQQAASGVYIYRITAGNQVTYRQMLLIK